MKRQINSSEIGSSFWNSTPIGPSISLCLCKSDEFSPQLILENKVFRSIIRLLNNSSASSQIQLIGTLITDDLSQRLTYVIDRFIEINDINNHQQLTGEFLIPLQCDKKNVITKNNFVQYGIKEINEYCCSSLRIELHRFLYLSGQMCFGSLSSVNAELSFDLLTIKNQFLLTPINDDSIQIIPTALLKNLQSSPINNIYTSQPHFGYCSLNRISKNKIVLALENDPQTSTLPLIGIWISGVNDIQSPFVWSACIRYCLNSSLKQRLRSGINQQQSFLLAFYSPTSYNHCSFYEVYSNSSMTLEYDVWACTKQMPLTNLSSYTYDFQFKRVNNQSKTDPTTLDDHHYQQTILSSPNTNGSLFGIPRTPPMPSPHQSPSWNYTATTPVTTPKRILKQPNNSPIVVSTKVSDDNRWKQELIQRMQSYETHIQSLTALVTQLLSNQQTLTSPPSKQSIKHDVAVQSEPSSPYVNEQSLSNTKTNQHSPSTTTNHQKPLVHEQETMIDYSSLRRSKTASSTSIPTDVNPVDILRPIFQFIDKQQQHGSRPSFVTTSNSPNTPLININESETDDQTLTNVSQQQQQHVTSTRTTGISLISNGVQMQFINQQSSTTSVYPQTQSASAASSLTTELILNSPQKSENNLSIEVHGLEMKYLEDDQLAVAIECDRQSQIRTPTIVDKSLSFETQEYLRRYGLFTESNSS